MSVESARQDVASAINEAIPGLNIRPSKTVKVPQAGDGWVTFNGARPATFRDNLVTFRVVIIAGQDENAAEDRANQWAAPLIDAVTDAIPCSNVSVETALIVVDPQNTALYALLLNLSMEV